ncbi:MAG: hypothetical protein KDD41_06965 [Flavobacteriales bacterium]|nr:hypothetical protein [Flavobacteriales bacterium]
MKSTPVHLKSADICILPGGIMHIHIKKTVELSIDDSAEIVAARSKLANNKPYPLLYTATRFVLPSKEVREYVASEERSSLVIADAFVVNSLPQKIIANTFLRINKPVRPTRIFKSKKDAIKWLQQFITPESAI